MANFDEILQLARLECLLLIGAGRGHARAIEDLKHCSLIMPRGIPGRESNTTCQETRIASSETRLDAMAARERSEIMLRAHASPQRPFWKSSRRSIRD